MTDELLQSACTAREQAHAPYSEFKVGAAVRGESGRIFGGCNIDWFGHVENVLCPALALLSNLEEAVRDAGIRVATEFDNRTCW